MKTTRPQHVRTSADWLNPSSRMPHRDIVSSLLRFIVAAAVAIALMAYLDWITIHPAFVAVLALGPFVAQVAHSILNEETESELERVDPNLMIDYEDDFV